MRTLAQFRSAVSESTDKLDLLALLGDLPTHHEPVQQHPNHDVDQKIKAIDAKIAAIEGDTNDWKSRQYKTNNKVVTPGGVDNLNANPMRIDQINQNRRARRVGANNREIQDLRNDRKRLLNSRHPENVAVGDTVTFYDSEEKFATGKIASINRSGYGTTATIHDHQGKTFVRPLNHLMKN